MAFDDGAARTGNSRSLGALWALYGLLRILAAAAMIVNWPIATVMFGALLSRVGNAFLWMSIFHFVFVLAIVISIFSGIFGLLAGATLLTRKASARTLSLVASVLSVSDPPLGTPLSVYTMIVFLR